MALHTRAESDAEITELRKLQLEAVANATFGCWTREQEAAYRERSDRLALLALELATPTKSPSGAPRVLV